MNAIEAELMDNKENYIYSDTDKRLTSKIIQNIPLLFYWGPNEHKELEKKD